MNVRLSGISAGGLIAGLSAAPAGSVRCSAISADALLRESFRGYPRDAFADLAVPDVPASLTSTRSTGSPGRV